jgi:hypothetical protein
MEYRVQAILGARAKCLVEVALGTSRVFWSPTYRVGDTRSFAGDTTDKLQLRVAQFIDRFSSPARSWRRALRIDVDR